MIRIFTTALAIGALGLLFTASTGTVFAGISPSSAKRAIQSELDSEEAALANGNADGFVKYDDPHYQYYTKTGAIRVWDKPDHLQGARKTIKLFKHWAIKDTIRSISVSGDQANVIVARNGTYQVSINGKTTIMAYTDLERQVWNKTGRIWIEQVAFIKQSGLGPQSPPLPNAKRK